MNRTITAITSSQTRRTLATTAYVRARASNALHNSASSAEREAAAAKKAASQEYNKDLYSGTTQAASPDSRPKYVHATASSATGEKISDPRVKKQDHGEVPGPFPSSALYTNYPPASSELVDTLQDGKGEARMSSTSASPAHPTTTTTKSQGGGLGRAGEVPRNEEGVGSSSAVRFRSAPGEMASGGDGGLGLMKKGDS